MKRLAAALFLAAISAVPPLLAEAPQKDPFEIFELTLKNRDNLRADHRTLEFQADAPIYKHLQHLAEKGGIEETREAKYSGQPVLIVTIGGKQYIYYPGYKGSGKEDQESLYEVEVDEKGTIKGHPFSVALKDGQLQAVPRYQPEGVKPYTVAVNYDPKKIKETSDTPLAQRGAAAVKRAEDQTEPAANSVPAVEEKGVEKPEAVYAVKGAHLYRDGQVAGYRVAGKPLFFAYGDNPPVNGRNAGKGSDEWTLRSADGKTEIGTWKELDVQNAGNRYVAVDGKYESRFLVPVAGNGGLYRDAQGRAYQSSSRRVYTGRRCKFLRGCSNTYAWQTTIHPAASERRVEAKPAAAVPLPKAKSETITARADAAAGPDFAAQGRTAAMTFRHQGRDHTYEYGVSEDGKNLIYKAADGSWRKSTRDLYYRDAATGSLYKPDGTYMGRIGFADPGKVSANDAFVTAAGYLHTPDGKLHRYDGGNLALNGKPALLREGLPPALETSFGKVQEFEFKDGELQGLERYGFKRISYEGQSPSDAPSWISADGKVRITRPYHDYDGRQWIIERKTQVPELALKEECVFTCGRGYHLASRPKMSYAERWVADASLREKKPDPKVQGTPKRGSDTVLLSAGNSLLMGQSGSKKAWAFNGERAALIMDGDAGDFYMRTPASVEKQAASLADRMQFFDAKGAQRAYTAALGAYEKWYGYQERGSDVASPADFRTRLDAAVTEKLRAAYAKSNEKADEWSKVDFEEGVSPAAVIAWQLGTEYESLRPSVKNLPEGGWEGEVVGVRRSYNRGPQLSMIALEQDRMGMPIVKETPLYVESSNISVPQFARWIDDPRGTASRSYVTAHALQFRRLAAHAPADQTPGVFETYIENIPNPYATRVNQDGYDEYIDPEAAGSFSRDIRGYVLAKLKEDDPALYKKVIGSLSARR